MTLFTIRDLVRGFEDQHRLGGICLEFSAMVFLGVEVGCDDDAVAELAAGEGLLSPLAIRHRVELHKHLGEASKHNH